MLSRVETFHPHAVIVVLGLIDPVFFYVVCRFIKDHYYVLGCSIDACGHKRLVV